MTATETDLPQPNAGWSTCPICQLHWLITPRADCMVPACGCFNDLGELGCSTENSPCEPCGIRHAFACEKLAGTRIAKGATS